MSTLELRNIFGKFKLINNIIFIDLKVVSNLELRRFRIQKKLKLENIKLLFYFGLRHILQIQKKLKMEKVKFLFYFEKIQKKVKVGKY